MIAPIGMLDLSSTLTLTPSVKWALVEVRSSLFFTPQQPFVGLAYQGKDIVFRFVIEYSSLRDFGS